MGTLQFTHSTEPFDVDDNTLAHLEAVIVAKLRRREPFLLSFVTDDARSGIWVHEASNLVFTYGDAKPQDLNRDRLTGMMRDTNRPVGLVLDVDALAAPAPTV